jgi:hypothetical protein
MSKVQTDNSYFKEKVELRIRHLPNKDKIMVLDAFAGNSRIWNKIKSESKKEIKVIGIDKKDTANNSLKGDNVKYLKTLNLEKFDIIDLDAYGIPFDQLQAIFGKINNQTIFVTMIQSMYGGIPLALLKTVGITEVMYKKCPTLFRNKLYTIMQGYLQKNGVKSIYLVNKGDKKYF